MDTSRKGVVAGVGNALVDTEIEVNDEFLVHFYPKPMQPRAA